jgi:RimJ/RimL family protein N-acetyltransferase
MDQNRGRSVRVGRQPFLHPLDAGELRAYLLKLRSTPNEAALFNAALKNTGELAGHVQVTNINTIEKGAGFISKFIIKPPLRGMGLGDKLLTALLSQCFGPMDLERTLLGVVADNKHAVNCYRRGGFREVRIDYKKLEFKGTKKDLVWMDLRKENFPGNKGN